jgi:hypothetical protein
MSIIPVAMTENHVKQERTLQWCCRRWFRARLPWSWRTPMGQHPRIQLPIKKWNNKLMIAKTQVQLDLLHSPSMLVVHS